MPATIRTARLELREVVPADAPFILALLNDPGFLANIGDRGVRTQVDATRYIEERFRASYVAHGFGFHLVAAAEQPIGICGFVRRDGLDAPDLGFAFVARDVRRGYGLEAATAMLRHGTDVLGLDPVLAIAKPDNAASIGLLLRLGFVDQGLVTLPAMAGPSRLLRYASSYPADLAEVDGILTSSG